MSTPRQITAILILGIFLELLAIALIATNAILLVIEGPTHEEQRAVARRLALIFTGGTIVSATALWAFLRYREESGLAIKMGPTPEAKKLMDEIIAGDDVDFQPEVDPPLEG
ncbi:MAG: hypothetical protein ACE5OZ_20965 [Candidatus Heimdallarchaeota archaeon]